MLPQLTLILHSPIAYASGQGQTAGMLTSRKANRRIQDSASPSLRTPQSSLFLALGLCRRLGFSPVVPSLS